MKRRRWWVASVVALFLVPSHTVEPTAQGSRQTVTYSAATDTFPNPERGFFHTLVPFFLDTQRYPLDAVTLRGFRADGITVVKAYYIIDEFRNSPLSQAALDGIAADFVAARLAGVKVIPRFAYSFPCAGSLDPCSEANITAAAIDPPLGRVLAHIDQLTPLLRASSDVIAFMEMGFVGAWGEWHHSSTALLNSDHTLNSNSSAIVDRVLFALPVNRMAVLRYPYHKQALYGQMPLDVTQAFTNLPQARIGAHNDCFLAAADDFGTYDPPGLGPLEKNVRVLHKYLGLDNRFVPQGGETCSTQPAAQPYIGCANALNEFALLHWSAINIDYQPDVINLWTQQGCLADIQQRLGYRLRLIDLDAPAQVAAGGLLTLHVNVTNDGWAAPFNPRAVEMLLRHTVSGRVYVIPVNADPRLWGPGETHSLDVSNALPAGLETGSYDLLLNLHDPEAGLDRRPEYSIRLANANVWEPATGYNNLLARVTIGN